MLKGILNVNKEKGISSARVVSLVRRALGMKKVGHTGTLDLEASGVLPIVLGKATRVSDYMMTKDKVYETELILGAKTDTLDAAGKILEESDKEVTKEEFLQVMNTFKGEIEQIPPMYSALKVNGKKLYDLAREGIEIERKKRKVNIYDIELLFFAFPKATIRVTCSKGTYIRTLVDDIGEKLGSLAYVNELKRVRVGDFDIKDSIKSGDLLEIPKEELIKKLYSIDTALKDFEKIVLDRKYLDKLVNGQVVEIDKNYGKIIRVYAGDDFIGLGNNFSQDGKNFLKMEKVFYERSDKNI
ncbi:tRNA pseudouridine(55) synthase TruB [Anaerococcus degeneri]|uniref:tRNA pseudouridine synthase B n=1 Tax=Anaerococcus degeneri TaxID=361500 RepID=A0ABS7YVD6_9FIRM|nr:tRNA pseudouridine(55) synthase TruB [Anaerococcus degeneri]MBP2015956.1 tRNA pseudouridine55 synthase [Anaerococcus degeneri]MCA2095702.1 tRNA pseudouridine(55) synthase TruB [Anaerococcus degeneri]